MLRRGILRRSFPTGLAKPCTSQSSIEFRACSNLHQTRNKTWFNPLSKFKKPNQPNQKKPIIIVEEPDIEANSKTSRILSDLNHYSKTTEIPKKLRRSILTSKFNDFVHNTPIFNVDDGSIQILNSAFLELFKLNDNTFLNGEGHYYGPVDFETLMQLFEKSSLALISSLDNSNNINMPAYMSSIVQFLVKSDIPNVPVKALVYVVDLAVAVRPNYFLDTLNLLVHSKSNLLTPEFINSLIDYYEKKNEMNLEKYEQIFEVSNLNQEAKILDDYIYKKFILYIESLYSDEPPSVHEYKDPERNLYRIQSLITTKLTPSLLLDRFSPSILIHLSKLSYELDSVFPNQELKLFIIEIFKCLTSQPPEKLNLIFEEVRRELFQQDFEDESLVENLLLLSHSKYVESTLLQQMLFEFIESNDVKFSPMLRFQNHIYNLYQNNFTQSESEIFDVTKQEVESFIESQNNTENELYYNDIYTRCIQSAMVSGKIEPRGYFTQTLTNYFKDNYPFEVTLYSYKYRLDKAIEAENHVSAVNIFEDSMQEFVDWSHSQDPSVHATLSSLATLICQKMNHINDIFPIFTKIKQQSSWQSQAPTICALATRMLEAEYVGDTIEMLKRELPPIKSESNLKLPLNEPYGQEYRKLFTILHNFVLNYTNETTHETNWALYCELHKYFHAPYESYLPTMKFFCDKDRMNASLLIFRQIKRLSELHGNHQHLPPLREMYLYLFQQFGDKLYEEGILEIHEHLKMDISLPKQDIYLQNCILNAYSNLQDVPKVRDLFLSMISDPKKFGGINEDTVQIMIKTYTYSDMMYVVEFWNNLSKFDIVPNYQIFKQYLIAHVYHGMAEEAMLLTEEMQDYGLELSSDTLLAMHNYCWETDKQKLIVDWAKEKHPAVWDEAVKSQLLKGATNYEPVNSLIEGGNIE